MRYTPFSNDLSDVDPSELESLREVHEGWYVEYKSQLVKPQSLAKSLASFANQFGGWLFLGIQEDKHTGTAGTFPGIPKQELPQALESLRNAAKDIIRPIVEYRERIFPGPIESIGIDSNHSLLAIYVPEGPNTPYVHNDGRIYVRIGDSSSPDHAKDRATFDFLFRKGENKRRLLKALTDRTPIVSKAEQDRPFLHLAILTDPYETLGHRYVDSFAEFSELMKQGLLRFDNVFSTLDGFVARQVGGNDRNFRLFTWEYSRNGHSFVTVPIPILAPISSYSTPEATSEVDPIAERLVSQEFRNIVSQSNLSGRTILDLTHMPSIIGSIFRRHRTIMSHADISAPIYAKARIENVWRAIPFINLSQYLEHVEKYDIPLVQEEEFEWPPASDMSPCLLFPERDEVSDESEPDTEESTIGLWLRVMEALGIPMNLVGTNIMDLLDISDRLMERQVTQKGQD